VVFAVFLVLHRFNIIGAVVPRDVILVVDYLPSDSIEPILRDGKESVDRYPPPFAFVLMPPSRVIPSRVRRERYWADPSI